MLVESSDEDEKSHLCVIVAVAKAHSGDSSVVYGRRLDEDDFSGEGHPFQLEKGDLLYSSGIWKNKELTKENIRLGSVVKFREHGDAFVYERNTKIQRQVSITPGHN